MRKLIYITLSIFLLVSCYKDKGNYDYKEINDLDIQGIEKSYDLDVDDTLKIVPVLKGTIYSDTTKFTYEWEVGRRIISEKKDLVSVFTRTMKTSCRFIVKDKETEVEDSYIFELRINSSTAADAILVLSNYKGKAELSYLRIDKDTANFVSNYYYERMDEYLGTNPKMMTRNFYQYVPGLSGVQVLVDEGIRNINSETLKKDTLDEFVNDEFFLNLVPPYPEVEFKDYDVKFVKNYVDQYRHTPYGSTMKTTYLDIIAGGRYFGASLSYGQNRVVIGKESPFKGELSPFSFSIYQKPKVLDLTMLPNIDIGYSVSSYTMLFDKTVGKFVYFDRQRYIYEIEEFAEIDYKGFDLIYGSHTSEYNNCYAVLTNNDISKFILIKAPGSGKEKDEIPFQILGSIEVNTSLINRETKFYTENYGNDMYFSNGNSFYKYNVKNIAMNVALTPSNKVFDLTKYGYDSSAKITAMFVTRTEKSIILGVSRYGEDKDASSDELKGDLLIIDNINGEYKLLHKYVGISGYPVDVMIKYKDFCRDGKDFNYVLKDRY